MSRALKIAFSPTVLRISRRNVFIDFVYVCDTLVVLGNSALLKAINAINVMIAYIIFLTHIFYSKNQTTTAPCTPYDFLMPTNW